MIRSPSRSLGRLAPRLLAILVVCLTPAVAAANSLTLINECRSPVVVHTSYVINGQLIRNKPHLLRFNERTPAISRAADLTVTICDGQVPGRVLFQGAVRTGNTRLHFGIAPVPGVLNRVQMLRRAAPAGAGGPGMGGAGRGGPGGRPVVPAGRPGECAHGGSSGG